MKSETVSNIRIIMVLLALLISCRLSSQITAKDTTGYVPEYYHNALEHNLMIAASKGLHTEVERLILRGADANHESYDGVTPLIYSVANLKTQATRTLLSYNADPNKLSSSGETPLLIILRKYADLDQLNYTAVRSAREKACLEIAELLLNYGADIDYADQYGATVLNYAAAYGSFGFADLLIYYRADLEKKSYDGTTPLMAAIWAGHANVADLLVQNGANLEARDNQGFTPFLIAAQNGDSLLIDYLISKGIDIYEKELSGWDALSIAIKYDHRPAAELLVRKGEKFREQGKGEVNYYDIAAKYGRKEISEMLVKNGFEDNYRPSITQVETALSARMTSRDMYTGMSFLFREPRKHAGIVTGFDTKLWYTKVLVEESDNVYYQFMDKSSLVYAGIFKEIMVRKDPLKNSIRLYGSLSGGYFFGSRFKGTERSPDSKFTIIPALGIKIVRSNFTLFAGFEYMDPGFIKDWPVWLRTGVSYNFDLKQASSPMKKIKWY